MMILSDEILLQIKITSDDLSGTTLRELVEIFIILFKAFLAILEFTNRVVQNMLKLALLPWYIWVLFWSEVVDILLEQAWLQTLG